MRKKNADKEEKKRRVKQSSVSDPNRGAAASQEPPKNIFAKKMFKQREAGKAPVQILAVSKEGAAEERDSAEPPVKA